LGNVLHIIACLFGYIVIVFGIRKKEKAKRILESGIRTKAEIIGFDEENGSPLIEFVNQKNKWVVFELVFSAGSSDMNVGDVLDIRYVVSEEGYHIVVDKDGWRNRGSNFLLIGGILFFLFSFLLFLDNLGLIDVEIFRELNELF